MSLDKLVELGISTGNFQSDSAEQRRQTMDELLSDYRWELIGKDEEIYERLSALKADAIILMPGKNEEQDIARNMKASYDGLVAQIDSGKINRAVLIPVEGGSTDRTYDVMQKEAKELNQQDPRVQVLPFDYFTLNAHKEIARYLGWKDKNEGGKGLAGKGLGIITGMMLASAIDTYSLDRKDKVIAMEDADALDLKTSTIMQDIDSILETDAEFALSEYVRHKYDGTITNNIVHPAMSLFTGNAGIRQWIGGDFAFSQEYVDEFLDDDVLREKPEALRFGIDIAMSAFAAFNDMEIGVMEKGVKKHSSALRKYDDPSYLNGMFSEVLPTMFYMIASNEDKWSSNSEVSKGTHREGAPYHEIHDMQGPVATEIFKAYKDSMQNGGGSSLSSLIGEAGQDDSILQYMMEIADNDEYSIVVDQENHAKLLTAFYEVYKNLPENKRDEMVDHLKETAYKLLTLSGANSYADKDHSEAERGRVDFGNWLAENRERLLERYVMPERYVSPMP